MPARAPSHETGSEDANMVDVLKLHELGSFLGRRGVNNHKAFSLLSSYGFTEMRGAGIVQTQEILYV